MKFNPPMTNLKKDCIEHLPFEMEHHKIAEAILLGFLETSAKDFNSVVIIIIIVVPNLLIELNEREGYQRLSLLRVSARQPSVIDWLILVQKPLPKFFRL